MFHIKETEGKENSGYVKEKDNFSSRLQNYKYIPSSKVFESKNALRGKLGLIGIGVCSM